MANQENDPNIVRSVSNLSVNKKAKPAQMSRGLTQETGYEMDPINSPSLQSLPQMARFQGEVKAATAAAALLARNRGERKPFHQKLYKTPKETANAFLQMAQNKCALSTDRQMIQSFLAGIYICFGGTFSIVVAKGIPHLDEGISKILYGACFSVGLMFIVLLGSELFTSNTMSLTIGLLGKSINWKDYAKLLTISYFFNFLGCVFGAGILIYFGDIFDHEPYITAIRTIAEVKCSLPPHVAFLRAISANWLVCIAIFIATASETVGGKMLACLVPLMTFVASSFEHSIANMFYVPLGLFLGAQTNFGIFIYRNLILVTLGNFIGGGFFMGVLTWYLQIKVTHPPKDGSIKEASVKAPSVRNGSVKEKETDKKSVRGDPTIALV